MPRLWPRRLRSNAEEFGACFVRFKGEFLPLIAHSYNGNGVSVPNTSGTPASYRARVDEAVRVPGLPPFLGLMLA